MPLRGESRLRGRPLTKLPPPGLVSRGAATTRVRTGDLSLRRPTPTHDTWVGPPIKRRILDLINLRFILYTGYYGMEI